MAVDKYRGAHHVNRISPSDIGVLLSAQSYRPDVTNAIRKIKTFHWETLQDITKNKISPGPHPAYGGSYPCLKTKNVQDILAEQMPADYAYLGDSKAIEYSKIEYGDLLINLTGSGSIGRVSVYYGTLKPITNQHIARISLKSDFDEGFVVAFLRSWWGERALEQGIAGSTGQINMVNDHVRSIPVIRLSSAAQKYIGDKVRQAERLRAWGKGLEGRCFSPFQALVDSPPPARKFWKAKKEDLEEYRINAKHYDPVALGLIKRAWHDGVELQRLEALLGDREIAGGATPKGAEYYEDGVLFARVQNILPFAISLDDAVYIDVGTDRALSRSRCVEDDIVLTITGYPGTASLITEDDLPLNINQHSVRIDSSEEVRSGYLCAALNSQFLKYQVDRLAIGGTRDALDYPSVKNLLIPRFSDAVEESIDGWVRFYIAAQKLSKKLTTTAKLLVEALIEGVLTETDLIEAQKALEAGDDGLDRQILGRIAADGVDGSGEPLFADLDQLYELLEQADLEHE